MTKQTLCSVCQHRQATKLCDGRKYPDDRDRAFETCDAPLCDDCTYQHGGPVFMCKRPRSLTIETIDYCPTCRLRRFSRYRVPRLKWNH